ncbi:MAG TPA: ABC transporter permease [Negativicutes bacterium]|nr:ABC transporter permease [Negativicutes bacterium]
MDFSPLKINSATETKALRPHIGFRQDAWMRLKKNRAAMAGLSIIIIISLLAILGPLLSPYSYSDQSLTDANQPPSASHWFGTDNLGRDLATRVCYGARISLSIGIVASLINLGIGVLYGGISGYFGGRIDSVMMRIVDILYGIPLLLYVILLMVVLKPGLLNVFIALGLVYWLRMARIVRVQVLSLKELEYILAARVLGASHQRLIFGHLLPNSLGPIIVTLTLSIPEAIFIEAFLSFIGLGVSAPMASWGVLASEGVVTLRSYPFQLLSPAVAISLTMLGFNFLGDGLRDALDPRMRR